MHIDEFIQAAKKNDVGLIKAYLQNGFDINTQDKDGFTAVMEAAEFGYKDLFWFLIEKGADVLIKADYSFSIIHAVGLGGDKKMLDYVISKGACIDEKVTGGEQDGMTIKDYALLAKNEELSDFLHAKEIFDKWIEILRLKNNWDILLEEIDDPSFKKTGDFKIDPDDRKAILLLNAKNPLNENIEEVIVHELLHLKLYPLDQLTETLIENNYEQGTKEYNTIYTQFMTMLEQTVEELTKCYLGAFGENKTLSYGRCRIQKSFNELYKGLKSL